MTVKRNLSLTPRLLVGLSILTLGIALLLDNLDLLRAADILRFWFPALAIALGVMSWRYRRTAGAALVVLGVWSTLGELELLPWTSDLIGPLVLVFFGASLVWRAAFPPAPGSLPAATDSHFFTVAVWGGLRRKVSSSNFRSGEAIAVMGGCKVDLRSSFIAEDQAEIFVFAMWGGAEILVPEDWSVTSLGIPLMGGFEDQTEPPRGGSRQRLVVHGAALMGGVEIRNHEEGER